MIKQRKPHPMQTAGDRAKSKGISHASLARKIIEARVTVVTERTVLKWLSGETRPDIGQWKIIQPVIEKAMRQ